jgi:ABC-2 type transport system permease protein
MLQQFGVAFGALSFVRERQAGIVDVYKIAPVGASEALVGKYLAYLPIGGVIGAALTALMVGGLGVADTSNVMNLAIVMGLSLFASIGLGLIISLVSATDAQAVQYTMIVLLASLFFSGFFLSIGQLQGVGQAVSWLLPVSYGMEMLRDVMLRGAPINRDTLLGLTAYGVIAFFLALIGTRRRMDMAP